MTLSICLKNNSSKTIYYERSYDFPDTSLKKSEDFPGINGRRAYKIKPGEQDPIYPSFER
jgi:hypothetical protein